MSMSPAGRVGVAGAAVVGVAFGMARYAYGLTLPGIRQELALSEMVLGLVASATFAGYLAALLLAGRLADRHGPRAPTTVGGVSGALGAASVTLANTPWLLAVGVVLAGSAGGWVWAAYSDIVARTVAARQQPRALAIITTGTGGGLVALGGLALLGALGSWRVVWAGIAVAAMVAAALNLRLVPRSEPSRRLAGGPGSPRWCGCWGSRPPTPPSTSRSSSSTSPTPRTLSTAVIRLLGPSPCSMRPSASPARWVWRAEPSRGEWAASGSPRCA
ncbi:MFS transporter [Cellulomonas sp. ATA003]|uniref:MFS transporter n=1 Tax=Cellulomonas sp. ATA003 TaxID=3073064 RepID=UPI002872F4FB|nr:MFS transporter [Cellulomonas sp. ATA003]WNB84803.1 MFS transporter [Cellulomonas sp. ATA003]